jgi:S-adenosylmethionine decarboxylase
MTPPTPAAPLGYHLLADFHGVAAERLNQPEAIARLLQNAALALRVTVLGCHMHHFGDGGGVTGVLLLAESHMSIHTWPELGFAAIDVFTCTQEPPQAAIDYIEQQLRPERVSVQASARGQALVRPTG